MRKVIIICLLILVGCTQSTITIDTESTNYSYHENTVQGSARVFNMISKQDDYAVFLTSFQGDTGYGSLLRFTNSDNPTISTIIDYNASSNCGSDEPLNCGGYIEDESPKYFQTYNNKIYYLSEYIDNATDKTYSAIVQMDLDGTHRTEFYRLPDSVDRAENFIPFIYFSNGYLYYTFGANKVTKVDMQSMEEVAFLPELDGSSYIYPLFYEDEIYFNIGVYNDSGTLITKAFLKYHGDSESLELIDTDVSVRFVDGDNFFFYKMLDTVVSEELYMKSMIDDNEVSFDLNMPRIVRSDAYYLLMEVVPGEAGLTAMTVDMDGNIMSELVVEDGDSSLMYLQIVIGNYAYYTDLYNLYYIELDDDGNLLGSGEVETK